MVCEAAMQWEIAATSAVVWNVDRCDVCTDACAWPTNETTTEPEGDAACRRLGQEWGSALSSELELVPYPVLGTNTPFSASGLVGWLVGWWFLVPARVNMSTGRR